MRYLPFPTNRKYLFFLFVGLYCSGCTGNKNDVKWDEVRIDPDIARDTVYQHLDKQKEVLSFSEELDTLNAFKRRSSDVAYFRGKKIDLIRDEPSKWNNCRAYYFSAKDEMQIIIGISDLFTGRGFTITNREGVFFTEPFLYTDQISEDDAEPIHKVIYQNLTLDKPHYLPGDSLYGKIEFKSIEINAGTDTTEHFGRGHFRAKVNTPFWL